MTMIRKGPLKVLLLAVLVVGGALVVTNLISTFQTTIATTSLLLDPSSFLSHSSADAFPRSLNRGTTPSESLAVSPADNASDVVRKESHGVSHDVTSQHSTSLPSCPEVPPNLVGYKKIFKDVDKPMTVLEKEWGMMLKPGGHYAPPDCLPKDRTAIIIPCRNRWPHLRVLLNHLIPVLIRQQLSFSFFVIESDQASHFNKGILLNVGFLEALKYGNYTCFIFQDVDMLTLNDKNLYRCGPHPKHLAVAVDKYGYKPLPYGRYFGGALALSREQVEMVNGHSNVYFGWGGEDDDMEYRVRARGYKIFRLPLNMSQFHTLRHTRDEGNEETVQKRKLRSKKDVIKRMDADGFRQAAYEEDWVHVSPLFTWIKVTINEKQVIENLPEYVRAKFKNGLTLKEKKRNAA